MRTIPTFEFAYPFEEADVHGVYIASRLDLTIGAHVYDGEVQSVSLETIRRNGESVPPFVWDVMQGWVDANEEHLLRLAMKELETRGEYV